MANKKNCVIKTSVIHPMNNEPYPNDGFKSKQEEQDFYVGKYGWDVARQFGHIAAKKVHKFEFVGSEIVHLTEEEREMHVLGGNKRKSAYDLT